MPANSWPENNTYDENSDPLDSILTDPSVDELSEVNTDSVLVQPSRFQRRRGKAALVLTIVWTGTIALHLVSWASIFILALTTMLGIHALRIIFTKRPQYKPEIGGDWPFVSILVAAKNEEAVIGRLIKNLCSLEYPNGQYEVWIIDDNSTDSTPQLLAELKQEYQQLNIFSRSPGASGG